VKKMASSKGWIKYRADQAMVVLEPCTYQTGLWLTKQRNTQPARTELNISVRFSACGVDS